MWAERQNFPLIVQLHLLESRSPLRSRSDDLPLRSRSTWFFELRSPLRSFHLTFDPLRSTARPDLREGGQGPRSPHKQKVSHYTCWFFLFLAGIGIHLYLPEMKKMRDSYRPTDKNMITLNKALSYKITKCILFTNSHMLLWYLGPGMVFWIKI